MSGDERNDVEDYDLGSEEELNKLFKVKYNIQHESSGNSSGTFVLQLSQFDKSQIVAAGLSENAVALYDLATGRVLEKNIINLDAKKNSRICGLKCSNQNDNELFVCSSVGEVLLYDTRTSKEVRKFWDSATTLKPFTAFDLNCNGRVLCVGTEETKTDVFLSFFDVREGKMIGGYWESHEDDISVVKFHPTNPNSLLSGSLDGLINHFDISEVNEEEALQCTLNTERSVSALNWHKDNLISCLTGSNEVLFYDLTEMELIQEFSRANVTERMRRNCSMECNLIDCHNIGEKSDQIALMATSNFNRGECLRTLTYDAAGKTLRTHGNFMGNRQIVRCSYFNDTDNYFLTGGEGGIISLWRGSDAEHSLAPSDTTTGGTVIGKSEVGKVKRSKAHKNKPY